MWNFSFLTYAERSLIGPHFSTASLGYAFAENHYLLQLASFGGLAALNAAVAVGAGIVALLCSRKTRGAAMATALVLFTVTLTLPLFAPKAIPEGTTVSVVLIQTDVAVGQVTTHDTFESLTTRAHATYPDATLIILPEERSLEPAFRSDSDHKNFFRSTFGSTDTLIVHSQHEAFKGGMQNALVYTDGQGSQRGKYRKMFLMPGGEYMPYLMTAVFSLRPDTGLGKYMERLPTERLEPTGLVTVPLKGHTLGGLICSDVLSPQLYRFLVREHGATVLINSANPAWFHHSQSLFDKTIQMAKVHAVQNRTYYLQSSNGSPAFAIDPYGTIAAMTTGNGTQLIEVVLPGI
jgi:apolipoprotein N-acyltransferase